MKRRDFFKLTGTFTGGVLLLPDFLYSFAAQDNLAGGDSCVVFIQLNGGNDGLNTFVPYQDALYHKYRPAIALSKNEVLSVAGGMAFHPSLKGLAAMQQAGDLAVIQNVGYPEPVRSHFRSQEIWNTASASNQYLSEGWLGRYLDQHYKEHHPTGALNIDTVDNLAIKGVEPNNITVSDPGKLKLNTDSGTKLSDNPQLDFVKKVAASLSDGSREIQKALDKAARNRNTYPDNPLSKNLEWISRLIKGGLNSKVYYTSLNGFDTHDNQLKVHAARLSSLNDAVHAFYTDLKSAGKLQEVTIVVFSEFGRRVADNGRGTDHGTAAPMFIIGGKNKGKILGGNPNLADLDNGDLKHEIDFRSVYAALLKNKYDFDPAQIGIKNSALAGLF